jgi:tRNA pseudouridine38-40 synthase
MVRFRLHLEYAGTRYSGWQVQKNARTVQGEIQQAVRKVTGCRELELYGSGRTDAGVHALLQVAHLDVATSLAPDALRYALNDALPADINVLSVERASHRFHARHGAVARSYLYQVSRRRTAFGKPLVWWVKDPLDVGRMREAAAAFVGTHDFQSFTARDREEGSTAVRVEKVEVGEDADLILIRVLGSHFIWKMVRRIVGVLVEVGRGSLSPAEAAGFLESPSPVPARLTAPPSGLFLERVLYEGDDPDAPLRAVVRVPPVPPPGPASPRTPPASPRTPPPRPREATFEVRKNRRRGVGRRRPGR